MTSSDILAALHSRDLEVAELRAELTRVRAERDALKAGCLLVPYEGRMIAPVTEAEVCARFGISPDVARREFDAHSVGSARAKAYDLIEVVGIVYGQRAEADVLATPKKRRPKLKPLDGKSKKVA